MTIQQVLRNRLQRIENVQQTLKPQQIVSGHIIKLYPNNKALIQLGKQKQIAQLEASLAVGERYHFQVQDNRKVVHLKVLGEQLTDKQRSNISHLLKNLGVPESRHTIEFVQSLTENRIPFNRQALIKILPFLESAPNKQKAHDVITRMLLYQLPLTSNVFNALYIKETHQFSLLVQQVIDDIGTDHNNNQKHHLKSHLQLLLGQLEDKAGNFNYQSLSKQNFLQHIQRMLALTGLNYEHLIAHNQLDEQPLSIKQLLLSLLQGSDSTIGKERMQQLLQFLTGLQLHSVEETNHFIYASLIVPGERVSLNNDLYLQFESKKTEKNEINPDFCRILFYLDLGYLEETVIDMHIQNRVVSLSVFNDHPIIKATVRPLETVLKKRLADINYQLTSIVYKPLKDQEWSPQEVNQYQDKIHGVDFRV